MIGSTFITLGICLLIFIIFISRHEKQEEKNILSIYKKGGRIKKSPPKITKNYDDLLKREEWLKKRKEILERDNYECCRCHKKNVQLNVHHKYYLKDKKGNPVDPWDYPNSALITLCRDCHKLVHQNNKIKWFYKNFK